MMKNKKLFYGILIIVVFAVSGWWIWRSQIPEVYFCTQDSDCIIVKGDCCGCSAGGTATAINKKFEKEWYEKLPKDCVCIQVISNHPSCFKEPKCVFNRCVLLKSPERQEIFEQEALELTNQVIQPKCGASFTEIKKVDRNISRKMALSS